MQGDLRDCILLLEWADILLDTLAEEHIDELENSGPKYRYPLQCRQRVINACIELMRAFSTVEMAHRQQHGLAGAEETQGKTVSTLILYRRVALILIPRVPMPSIMSWGGSFVSTSSASPESAFPRRRWLLFLILFPALR